MNIDLNKNKENKMELKEMIKVMEHYNDGGEIEFSEDKFFTVLGSAISKNDGDLGWDWDNFTYRIKEQKQKVTIEKWLCKDREDNYIVIEGSNVVLFRFEKIKLLETYEVEL